MLGLLGAGLGVFLVLILAAISALFGALFIYGTISGFMAKGKAILALEDRQEIMPQLRELVAPNCRLIPTLEAAAALDDDEYFSFFHHVYIPYAEQIGVHSKRSISRDMKKVLWIPGFMVAGISIMLVVLGESSGTRKALLSLLFLAIGVGLTWALYHLRHLLDRSESKPYRSAAKWLDILHRIDDKLLGLNEGIEPPPSRISLEQALQDYDEFLDSIHSYHAPSI